MSPQAASARPALWKVGLLGALYFVQGLPFGFQSNALPLYLRAAGVSLTGVSLARALSLPWMLKVLWAPLVDRHGSPRFGRRKSWIVPMQALLALACLAAAWVPPNEALSVLLVIVFLMNLFAATQDIAVDGLAIDLLEPKELGLGNSAQVVGYKVGMLTGGGLLVGLSATLGWRFLFVAMAALCLAVMALVLRFREPVPQVEQAPAQRLSWRELKDRLLAIASRPGARWLLLFIATYKTGESLADAMYGPFLIDRGLPKESIAMWLGTWGMAASLLGSFAGGLLATRVRILTAVAVCASLRVVPLAFQWAMVAGLLPPEAATVIPITMAEHLFGGMLTTAMFALMMSQVDRRIGATHFTALASVEVLGKAPLSLASGAMTEALGYPAVFALAVALSAGFIGLLWPLGRALHAANAEALASADAG